MKESSRIDRRTVLSGVGSLALVGTIAGCSTDGGGDGGDTGGDGGDTGGGDGGDGGGGGATVVAGPNGDFVFDPESVTISTGETVTWEFASPNHNVVAWPDMHEAVSIPDGAEGFGSVEQDGDKFETLPEGETYSHTFDETGEFTYVCVPHASADMIGTVVVE
jgi:plastocyanin